MDLEFPFFICFFVHLYRVAYRDHTSHFSADQEDPEDPQDPEDQEHFEDLGDDYFSGATTHPPRRSQ